MGMTTAALKRLRNSTLAENILALSGAQALSVYVLPLITFPYLTRVLGVGAWGLVAFYGSFGSFLIKLVEYGFNYSGSRDVAAERDSRPRIGEILTSVTSAKLLLAAVAVVPVWVAYSLVPQLQTDLRLFAATIVWALGLAFDMTWFFQGLERLRFIAILNLVTKSAGVIAIFVFVRAPDDAWMVPGLYGASSWVAAVIAMAVAAKAARPTRPSLASIASSIRQGWNLFIYAAAIALMSVGNTFILGLFASPRSVGFFAAAERLIRLASAALDPITKAVYPRITYLIDRSRNEAARLARLTLAATSALSVGIGLGIYFTAPWLVPFVLGSDFEPTVPILRFMGFLPLLIAPSRVLGVQWMLPMRKEKAFNAIVISGGALNAGIGVSLAPVFGAQGMVFAMMLSQGLISGTVFYWLRSKRLSPFSDQSGDRGPRFDPLGQEPLVSVIVANHNYANFLPDAIESVRAQSYRNWEFVICDDGSTDNSTEVIRSYALKDPRIRLSEIPNSGQSVGLNTAFAAARGEVIMLLDSDDRMAPERISAAVEAFRDQRAGIFVHPLKQIGPTGKPSDIPPTPGRMEEGWLRHKVVSRGGIWITPASSGIGLRREVAAQVFPLPSDLKISSDGFITALAPMFGEVRSSEESLGFRRVHDRNVYYRDGLDAKLLRMNQSIRELITEVVNERLTEMGQEAQISLDDQIPYLSQGLWLGLIDGVPRQELKHRFKRLRRAVLAQDLARPTGKIADLFTAWITLWLPVRWRLLWFLKTRRLVVRSRSRFGGRR